MNWSFLAFFAMLICWGCSPSEKELIGTYVENNLGDTLELKADHSYEYSETLINRKTGWTNGRWEQRKRNVQFKIEPRPLMGFGLSIRKEGSSGFPVFKLFLGESGKGIDIESVNAFRNGQQVGPSGILISGNTLELKNSIADSIEINTVDFKSIGLGATAIRNEIQSLQLTPLERYYILDKWVFRYTSKTLRNLNKKDSTQLRIEFRKEG